MFAHAFNYLVLGQRSNVVGHNFIYVVHVVKTIKHNLFICLLIFSPLNEGVYLDTLSLAVLGTLMRC